MTFSDAENLFTCFYKGISTIKNSPGHAALAISLSEKKAVIGAINTLLWKKQYQRTKNLSQMSYKLCRHDDMFTFLREHSFGMIQNRYLKVKLSLSSPRHFEPLPTAPCTTFACVNNVLVSLVQKV